MAKPGDVYNRGMAQNLITLMAYDPVNGKIVANLIKPELFTGELRVIAERLQNFWKEFKTCPGKEHVMDLFSDILEDPHNHKRKTYRAILRNMVALSEGINAIYTIKMVRLHSQQARFFDAILKAVELTNRESYDLNEAMDMIGDVMKARDHEFNEGLKLSDVDLVFDRMESAEQEFRLGIAPFDRRGVTPGRGEAFLMLAPAKRGKTWFLVNTGKAAVLQRKKVLHISLEMRDDKIMQRYYQALFSGAKRGDRVEVPQIEVDDNLNLTEVKKLRKVKPRFVLDRSGRKKVKGLMRSWNKRRKLSDYLRVVSFPPRSLSMNMLRAYLDGLEASGFIPDMVILDYIGIVKTDAKNFRIELGRAFEDFRAIMVERNMAGVTAHQVGRAGLSAKIVKVSHAAEDISLINTADACVTYSQTPAEKRVGLARLWVDRLRGDEDGWGIVVTQTYGLGQFSLNAAVLSKKYQSYLDRLPKVQDDEKEDEKG